MAVKISETETETDRASVEVCKRFINMFIDKRQTINEQWTSYALKHVLEFVHDFFNYPVYVTNDEFMQAANELGFIMNEYRCFNMSIKKLKKFLAENNLDRVMLV